MKRKEYDKALPYFTRAVKLQNEQMEAIENDSSK